MVLDMLSCDFYPPHETRQLGHNFHPSTFPSSPSNLARYFMRKHFYTANPPPSHRHGNKCQNSKTAHEILVHQARFPPATRNYSTNLKTGVKNVLQNHSNIYSFNSLTKLTSIAEVQLKKTIQLLYLYKQGGEARPLVITGTDEIGYKQENDPLLDRNAN